MAREEGRYHKRGYAGIVDKDKGQKLEPWWEGPYLVQRNRQVRSVIRWPTSA